MNGEMPGSNGGGIQDPLGGLLEEERAANERAAKERAAKEIAEIAEMADLREKIWYDTTQDIYWNITITIYSHTAKLGLIKGHIGNASTLGIELGSQTNHTHITIPSSVTINGSDYVINEIIQSAFEGCTKITSIIIPNSVKTIGDYSFTNTNLMNVTLPISLFQSLSSSNSTLFSNASYISYKSVADYYSYRHNVARNIINSQMGDYHWIEDQLGYFSSYDSKNKYIYDMSGVRGVSYYSNLVSAAETYSRFAQVWARAAVNTNYAEYITDFNKHIIAFNFTCIFNTSNENDDGLQQSEIDHQLNGYNPGEIMNSTGIAQTIEVSFNDTVTKFAATTSFKDTHIGSVTISKFITDIGTVFSECTELNSVYFGDNEKITNIPIEGFLRCSNLKTILLPKYITTIGAGAFLECTSLLGSPNNNKLNLQWITSIGSSAFNTCSSLTEVSISTSKLTSIGPYAFSNCSKLEYINLPTNTSYTMIENNTFLDCTSLLTVTIPSNINTIGIDAFYTCTNLTNVSLNSGLTTIKGGAFQGCSSLSYINTPPSLINIDTHAFYNCNMLSLMTLSTRFFNTHIASFSNHSWKSSVFGPTRDASAYDPSMYKYKCFFSPMGPVYEGTTAMVSGTITPYSSDYSTVRGTPWKIISENNDVLDYGHCALNNITDDIAFRYTKPDGTEYNVTVTFDTKSWHNETSVTVGNFVEYGGFEQFLQFTLTEEVRPDIKIEYYYIFASETPGSTVLTSIDVFNLVNKWKLTNMYTIGLFNAYIDDSVTIIDTYAFKSCINLKTISIGYQVQEIRAGTFEGCSNLENFYIGTNIDAINNSQLTIIGDSVFNGCNIQSIIIPTTVKILGKWLFYNASKLQEVIFYPDTMIETIDEGAFANCSNLELLRIPNSVKHINNNAFSNCVKLNNILLPSTLETIGESAFTDCTGITFISIPYSVSSIGQNAFRNIKFADDSYISISSLFKKNINSIFNYQLYTNTLTEEYYNIYQLNLLNYNYYTWIKRGMVGIAESSMGSQNHTLVSQTGYFEKNKDYITRLLTGTQFDWGNDQAKPSAEGYIRINTNTGSSLADTNIANSYYTMKNALLKFSAIPSTYGGLSSNIFQYHYDISSNTNTLTKEQVHQDISGNTSSTISASIDNNITIISEGAFENVKISNIELNDNITDICNNAFNGTLLTGMLKIPASVQHIGDGAFQDCSGLTSIIIPDGNLETIGANAFRGCNISHIYIPKTVTSIGIDAFTDCSNLNRVTLPVETSGNVPKYTTTNQNKSIYFNNSNDINDITFGYLVEIYPTVTVLDSVTSYTVTNQNVKDAIGEFEGPFIAMIQHTIVLQTDNIVIDIGAFTGTNVSTIQLGNSISEIRANAFADCTMLTSVNIGHSVNIIGIGAFSNCPLLKTVKIPSRHYDKCIDKYFSSNSSIIYLFYCILSSSDPDGILTEYDVFDQLSVGDAFTGTITVTFDSSVNRIDNDTFNGNPYIKTILVPNTIFTIGRDAFRNCHSLSTILCSNINSNLTTIEKNAFNGCNQLNSVTLPSSLLTIELGAFLACDSLWKVQLPNTFDYSFVTENNTFFEATMMKGETWKSDAQWSAGGTFFTFMFQSRNGTGYNYSPAKQNYMAKQRSIQSGKVAAHKKVIEGWNKMGEDVVYIALAVCLTVVIITTGGAAAGAGAAYFSAGEAVTVDAVGDAAADAGADAGGDAGGDAGADAGAGTSQSTKLADTAIRITLAMYVIDPLDHIILGSFFRTIFSTNSANPNQVSEQLNRNLVYGSMISIYNINGYSISNSVDTYHSSGSWKITTIIKSSDNTINSYELNNKFKKNIEENIPIGLSYTGINVQSTHTINSDNVTHIYVVTAIVETDYTMLTSNNKLLMTNIINSSLSTYLGIPYTNIPTNISTTISAVVSNTCFPKNTPIKTDQGIVVIENIDTTHHTINNNSIIAITKTTSVDDYLICFKKNVFGINNPSKDTIMSKDHKIYYKGQMIEAYKFTNKFHDICKVVYKGEILYNVLMDEYSKVNVNNLVCETLDPNNIVAKLYRDYNKIPINEREKIIEKISNYTKSINKPNKSGSNKILKQINFTS